MLEAGIKRSSTMVVKFEDTAASIGNEGIAVFSTPHMLSLMEMTCKDAVEEYLEDGEGTVGIRVDLEHLGATPVGMEIKCNAELVEVKGKKLVFNVECYDEIELVGRAKHERFVVDNEKFMKKLSSKTTK